MLENVKSRVEGINIACNWDSHGLLPGEPVLQEVRPSFWLPVIADNMGQGLLCAATCSICSCNAALVTLELHHEQRVFNAVATSCLNAAASRHAPSSA